MRYFVLSDTGNVPDRWYLGAPHDSDGKPVDPWQFTSGRRLFFGKPLRFARRQEGHSLPFSLAAFEVPIVDAETGELFKSVGGDDVELLHALVDGDSGSFSVLNVVTRLACVDDDASEFTRFPEDHNRPDIVGKYEMFNHLRIDKSKVSGHRLFRIKDWEAPLIVREDVRAALETMDLPGLIFQEV